MFEELPFCLSLISSLTSKLFEGFPRGVKQLRSCSEIPIGIGRMHMAHVDGESRQKIIHRQTATIPIEHASYCEGVT